MFTVRSHWRPLAFASVAILFCVVVLSPVTLLAQPDPAAQAQKSDAPQSDTPQLDLLREQLDSPDPNERAHGIQHATQLDKKWAALALPRLIALLSDEAQAKLGNITAPVRYHAIHGLAKMEPWVCDALIEALDDKNRLVRMGAIDVLRERHEAGAVGPLIKLVEDQDRDLLSHANEALIRIGEPSIEPLLAIASSDRAAVRSSAAYILGKIRDPRVVKPVGKLLFDEDQNVRDYTSNSLYLLAFTGDSGTTWRATDMITDKAVAEKARRENDAILLKLVVDECNFALRSNNAAARLAAAKSMYSFASLIRPPETVHALANCLPDGDAALREQAVRTLSIINHLDVYKPLVAGLRDSDPKVRIAAADGLQYRTSLDHHRTSREFDDGCLVKPLTGALSDNEPRVRQNAAQALSNVRSPDKLSATADLLKLLHDENPEVIAVALRTLTTLHAQQAADPIFGLLDDPNLRSKAAVALSGLGDPRAVEPLRALAKEKDIPAIGALAGIKDHESVPMLIELLHDDKKEVREAAAAVLGSIGDSRGVAPLILLLRADSELTGTVAEALGKLKDPRAVQPMIDVIPREAARRDQMERRFEFDIDLGLRNSYVAGPLESMGVVAIEPLAKALSSDLPAVREVAAHVLYNLCVVQVDREDMQPAIEPLAIALTDSSANVRHHAAMALGNLGDARAMPALIATVKAAGTPNHWYANYIYGNAAVYLSTLKDPKSIEPLIALLADPTPGVRATAARALGSMRDQRALAPLLAGLDDQSPTVRRAATEALGYLKAASAFGPLVSRLKDDDAMVRLAAIESLGSLGDGRAADPLAAILDTAQAPPDSPTGPPLSPGYSIPLDFHLRTAAAIALVRLDDPRGVAGLSDCLKDPHDANRDFAAEQAAAPYIKNPSLVELMIAALDDPSIRVRLDAAYTLGHVATSAAVDALLAKTGDRENLPNILGALAETKTDRALGAIVRSLDDTDPAIRRAAASSLANLGNLAGADPLIAHLSDQSSDIRAAIIDTLMKLKVKTAVPALKSLANDEDPNVRAHAERALKRLDR